MMCTMSVVIDDFSGRLPNWATQPGQLYPPNGLPLTGWPSRAEFDALKAEVTALRDLIKAAKTFDEQTGQPDCETAEKVDLLKRIAKLVGVDLSDLIGNT